MSTRDVIRAADPARGLPPEALELDVDALLLAAAGPHAAQSPSTRTAGAPRRRRLDLALAAVLAAILVGVAFLPTSAIRHAAPGRSASASPAPATRTTATAEALLDGVRVPASAARVDAPPAAFLAKPRVGLACRGTLSARPRYWIVPGATLQAVQQHLRTHLPRGAARLSFTAGATAHPVSAFALYRPGPATEVVIALAVTGTGVGIRADADVAPGTTCLDPAS